MTPKELNIKLTQLHLMYFIQQGLDTDDYSLKVADVEQIRSVTAYLSKIANADFEHKDIHFYRDLSTEYLEMTFYNLKNLSINYFNKIDLFVLEVDDVFCMLDRAEQLSTNK